MPFSAYCSKCGNGISEDSTFCSKCGNPVGEVSSDSPKNDSTSKTTAKKSSKVGTILTYVGAGLAVLIFGSAILGSLNNSEDSNSSEPVSTSSQSESNPASEPQADSDSTQGADLPGFGDGLVLDSGVEIFAISESLTPSTPNEFVIDPDGVKGQLISVRFYLANGSNEELSVSNGLFTGLIGTAEYEPLAVFSDSGDWYVYEPVGAGLETTFDVFFDVPSGAKLTGAVFRSSMFFGDEVEFAF
jgi:hypothetical protein